MNILMAPSLILIIGSFFVPVFKGVARKIYVLLVPIVSLISLINIKSGTVYSIRFIEEFKLIILKADWLSITVGYAFLIIGIFALLYTIQVKNTAHHVLALLYLGGAVGIVFSGDFLSLYIFWELIAVIATMFVLLEKTNNAKNAAFRYLVMHLIGGLLLLGGIWLQYLQTGSILISSFATASIPFYLIIAGVGVNAGFVFLHTWIPDTYPKASYTTSVFLSVLTTKAAAYMLARIGVGWEFIAYMGAAMAVYGASMAMMQDNARKLFSYSIMSQVGFVVAAIGIGAHGGLEAATFHLFNNVLFKCLLFMTIGSVIYATGKENLSQLGGLAKKMPITAGAATIAALSMAGVPLLNGFVSKTLIFESAHSFDIIYLLLELAAVGTFLYSVKYLYCTFYRPSRDENIEVKDVPLNMNIAMGSVAIICLVIGVFPNLVTQLFPEAVESVYTSANIIGILQIIIIGSIAFYLGRESIFKAVNRITFDVDVIYVKVIESLSVVPQWFSDFNNFAEAKSERIPYYLSLTKKPVDAVTNFLSNTLFVLWVDFWLFKPASKLTADTDEAQDVAVIEKKMLFKPFYILLKLLEIITNRINKLEGIYGNKEAQGLTDKVFAQKEIFSGHKISAIANLIDKVFVDGLVNGLAKITFFFGDRARKMQSGLLQNYALIIVIVIAFAMFALSLKGGFK